MKEINNCLKEWNATIEALGNGYQTILIRTYTTKKKDFLLYPTSNYTYTKGYIKNFQDRYHSFIEKNALPNKEEKKTQIKYFASVEDIMTIYPSRINSIKDHIIWDTTHVKRYLRGKKGFLWLLRIYKLNEPHMADPTPGAIRYANLNEKVQISNLKPILSDKEFIKKAEEISNKISINP